VGIKPSGDFLEQALHIICSKGRLESDSLIDDTAQRPDV